MSRLTALPCAATVIRSITLATLSLSFGLAAAAGPEAPRTASTSDCAVDASLYDQRDIQCPLKANGGVQRLRFRANFSGGHDDTMASIKTSLNDRPLECDEGSKITLMGEDGDVSLYCRFSLAADSGNNHLLRVKVTWSHAQYTNFTLGPD